MHDCWVLCSLDVVGNHSEKGFSCLLECSVDNIIISSRVGPGNQGTQTSESEQLYYRLNHVCYHHCIIYRESVAMVVVQPDNRTKHQFKITESDQIRGSGERLYTGLPNLYCISMLIFKVSLIMSHCLWMVMKCEACLHLHLWFSTYCIHQQLQGITLCNISDNINESHRPGARCINDAYTQKHIYATCLT